jgi:large subunit ribosomal protein L4e
MAKLPIYNTANEKTGDIELPEVFSEPLRPDLISRMVLSIESNMRHPYGADLQAGQKVQAKLSRRRRDYKSSYGHGISRVPRKITSRNGTRINWVGALAPGTVKGRRAHPPKVTKDWSQTVSSQEARKATRSAIAATINPIVVRSRGHSLPSPFPFVLDDSFESLSTTKAVVNALAKLGFSDDLAKSRTAKHMTGKARLRGRSKQVRKSVLFVTATSGPLNQAARNIPGVEIALARNVNAKHLAPGTLPGRLTLYTTGAIAALEQRFSGATPIPTKEVASRAKAVEKKTSPHPAKPATTSKSSATPSKKAKPTT